MKKEKIGSIILIVVGLFLLISTFFKLSSNQQAIDMFTQLNLLPYLFIIGVIELIVCILLIVPKTQKIGAYTAFGYLGGAMVAHLTINDLANIATPIILFLVVLTGLFLKDKNSIY